jgi:hypothetical protein
MNITTTTTTTSLKWEKKIINLRHGSVVHGIQCAVNIPNSTVTASATTIPSFSLLLLFFTVNVFIVAVILIWLLTF